MRIHRKVSRATRSFRSLDRSMGVAGVLSGLLGGLPERGRPARRGRRRHFCNGLRDPGTGAGTILTFTSDEGAPRTSVSGDDGGAQQRYLRRGRVAAGLFVASELRVSSSRRRMGSTGRAQNSPTPLEFYGVAYGDNESRIAVGGNDVAGAGVILTGTPDGTTWTQQPSRGSRRPLTGVTYANGQFVAVGNNQVWSPRTDQLECAAHRAERDHRPHGRSLQYGLWQQPLS